MPVMQLSFEQLLSENRLRFPIVASVKVWRRASKPRAAQPGLHEPCVSQRDPRHTQQHSNDFDCFIVDASEQDMHETPSPPSTMLLPMLSNSADNVPPATLAMLRKSNHYAMGVEYITQEMPPELSQKASKIEIGLPLLRACSRVVVLVLSKKRSQISPTGDCGHQLVTADVADFLTAGSCDAQNKYSLTSVCTLDTVTDFKLDPPGRAKNQAALVSVTGVIATDADSVAQPVNILLLDNVQLVALEEAEALKPIFNKMLYFAALNGQVSRKREHEPWSAEASPAKASRCRVLSRSPTRPPLPEYSSTSAPLVHV